MQFYDGIVCLILSTLASVVDACEEYEFQCKNGTSRQCIRLRMACDMHPDCKDLSDEGAECLLRLCEDGRNGGCAHQCYATPKGLLSDLLRHLS